MQATPSSSPVEPGYAEVRRLDLQGPFHTRSHWSVYVPRLKQLLTTAYPKGVTF
jgi:hypothetical protein